MTANRSLRSPRPIWWDVACRAAAGMTSPKTDVARSDAELAEVLSRSRGARLVTSVRGFFGRAWAASRTRRAALAVASEWSALEPTAAIRVAGVTVTVAGVVVLALQAMAPVSGGWLTVALPIACAASAIGAIAFAPRLARLTDGRRP